MADAAIKIRWSRATFGNAPGGEKCVKTRDYTEGAVAFASRLENGDPLLTDAGNSRAVEVDTNDVVVWKYFTNTDTNSVPSPLPNGDSNWKYKILGVIDESHKRGYLPGRFNRLFSDFGDKESAIAKVAHKQGGDAVVFVARNQEPSSVDQYGNGHHRRSTELVVIKYVDESKPSIKRELWPVADGLYNDH